MQIDPQKDTNLNDRLSLSNRVIMAVGARIPYGIGARVLSSLFRVGLVRRVLMRGRILGLHSIAALNPTNQNFSEIVQRHLTCNLFMPWRVVAISKLDMSELDEWIRFKREDILRANYGNGRGVMLVNSHVGAGRIVALSLLRRGYKITTVDPEPYLAKMGARFADQMRVITLRGSKGFWLKEVYKARKVLAAGEVLTLVADGQVGMGGTTRTFHDVTISFHVSFADLAVQTEATVIQVFAHMDGEGSTTLEFLPPLHSGDATMTREDRVRLLLNQYVANLERLWLDDPGNVLTSHVRLYNRVRSEQLTS